MQDIWRGVLGRRGHSERACGAGNVAVPGGRALSLDSAVAFGQTTSEVRGSIRGSTVKGLIACHPVMITVDKSHDFRCVGSKVKQKDEHVIRFCQ